MSKSHTCYQCENEYQNLSSHWSRSPTCEFPDWEDRLHELFRGVLLAGGSVVTDGNYPSASITSMDKPALEWLHSEFGVFTTSIILRRTEEELRESHAERGWNVTGDLSPEYRLTFASHPSLREYATQWYVTGDDHREKRVPESLTRSPLLLKSWYVLNGRLETRDEITRGAFPITSINASESLLSDLHAPFNPRIRTDSSLTGSNALVLWDTAAFFDYIGEDPPDGLEDRWPDSETTLRADQQGERCPSCGRTFTYLSAHWGKNEDCGFPELSPRQEGILNALLVGGAYLNKTEETKRPHLLFDTTDESLIDWLESELGLLVSSVQTRSSAQEAAMQLSEAFGKVPNKENTGDVYRLQTRSHPFFEAATDWAGRDGSEPSFTPPKEMETPPALYKTLYLHRGSRVEYPEGTMSSVIRLNRIPTTPESLVSLFERFDGRLVRRTTDDPVLVIEDTDAFFECIGEPIEGHENLWGESLGSLFNTKSSYNYT